MSKGSATCEAPVPAGAAQDFPERWPAEYRALALGPDGRPRGPLAAAGCVHPEEVCVINEAPGVAN